MKQSSIPAEDPVLRRTNKKVKSKHKRVSQTPRRSICTAWNVGAALTIVLGVLLVCIVPRTSDLLPPFERNTKQTENDVDLSNEFYERRTVWFSSRDANNTQLSGWQYLPKDWRETGEDAKRPVVIMAHGLGGQRDFGLHRTADVFARAGLSVLVFDYRTFGGSDGEPRNWASPSRHLEDWRAAVKFANSTAMSSVWDASRLVLWGTSYSGGHVLVIANELQSAVSGVISQVPHLSGAAAAGASLATRGVLPSIRLFLAGVLDYVVTEVVPTALNNLHTRAQSLLGPDATTRIAQTLAFIIPTPLKPYLSTNPPPVYVRLTGVRNTMSVMALTPDEFTAYLAKHPQEKLGGWQNQVRGRLVLEATRYSPINHLTNITAPTLFVTASEDNLCPMEVVAEAAGKLGVGMLVYPVDHFSLYLGEVWAHTMAQQVAFVCNITGREVPKDPDYPLVDVHTVIGSKRVVDDAHDKILGGKRSHKEHAKQEEALVDSDDGFVADP